MANFDVFNGDADGLCALVQLRNAEPRNAKLITGIKRDINLLDRVDADENSLVTVLDISLDKNRAGLERALAAGASVFYCDHHFAGDIPDAPNLQTLINPATDVCTSLLINNHLQGAYRGWAVVGTFGDNLKDSARAIAKPLQLNEERLVLLENLGVYLNYNGYGSDLDDLHFKPDHLYTIISAYDDPFAFMADVPEHFEKLEIGYQEDMSAVASLAAVHEDESTAVFMLPKDAWARRVRGVYSNELANAHPGRAHAVITEKDNGSYLVSVRAPLDNKTGADELCMKFPTGGGRKAAAGINELPAAMLDTFVDTFSRFYTR